MTGEISDSMSGASHAGMGEMGKAPKNCTSGCVKGGAKYVFVSNGKVYGIQNPDSTALAANGGLKVQVTGDVDDGCASPKLIKTAWLEHCDAGSCNMTVPGSCWWNPAFY